jgi:dihydrofolate reductase
MPLDGFITGPDPRPDPPFAMPVFIVTHRGQSAVTKDGGTTYTFVTEGIHAALEQARAAAGGSDVLVVGGANIARQFLEAGLLDEVHVHVVPILLGGGVRLFEGTGRRALGPRQSLGSSEVTHLVYDVGSDGPT